MINELNPGYYELVRMPYMKMKNIYYFFLILALFLINLILAYPSIAYYKSFYVRAGYTIDRTGYRLGFFINANFGLIASVVSPLIIYVIPGYLYYQVCT